MRNFLLGGCLLLTAACGGGEPGGDDQAALTPAETSASLDRIADDYLDAVMTLNPLYVYFGLSDVVTPDHAALGDNSPAALRGFEKTEDALLAELHDIDPELLEARGDWVTYQSLLEAMEANAGLRVCRQELWGVSHMTGWQTTFSLVAQEQPVDTEDARAAAIERWSQVPRFLAQDRANLETGLAEGYSAPKRVVARVVGQLDSVLAAAPEHNPYMDFVRRADGDRDFQSAAGALFASEVMPALAEYRDFLRDDYMPAARDALAITALPKGAECYEAMLRNYHSAKIGAKRTFDRGSQTVDANRQAVIDRGQAMFGIENFEEILKRVKEVPENRFSSEQELIDFTRALEPEARTAVAPFFSSLPAQKLIVEPYPDYLKGTGQPSSYEQKPDADGAAIYRINSDDWETQTRGEAEIVLVHEGWPGHHLQIATARGVEGLHPVTRLAGSTAYIEGWARYSEALAEEAGIYKDGYGEISRRAWPARGMVVDPGLHVYGWTNEQAKAFLIESGRQTEKTADDMLDRIAVIPGQLTAYDTGGLEIMALRSEAEERLGGDFDIRDFHERILENGALPLGALREHVEAWIAENE